MLLQDNDLHTMLSSIDKLAIATLATTATVSFAVRVALGLFLEDLFKVLDQWQERKYKRNKKKEMR